MAFEDFTEPSDPYEEGYMAYVNGDGGNPYDRGTEEFDDWLGGWRDAFGDH